MKLAQKYNVRAVQRKKLWINIFDMSITLRKFMYLLNIEIANKSIILENTYPKNIYD